MKQLFPSSIYLVVAALCIAVLVLSCEGPDGETGPAGPAGPQGAQGAQGIQGKPGNANVITSPWTKVPDSAWVVNRDCTYYLVSLADARINSKVLDSSLVMAYYRNFGRENIVFPLPSVTNELSLGFYMEFLNNQGRINFDLTFFEARKEPIDFDLEFRWIIIPPNAGGRLKNVNWRDYEAVRSNLGLVD